MDSRFSKAVAYIPKGRKVLGKTLLPICLRHRVVLEYYDSPFVTGEEITAADVIMAVRVMSTFDKNEMHRGPTEEELDHIILLQVDKDRLQSVVADIKLHIEENSNWPVFWNKNKSGQDNGLPWEITVVSSIVRNGIPYEQAWTMPEAEAIWLHACNMAADGIDFRIVSDEDIIAMEAHNKAEEEFKKAQEAAKTNV